MQERKLQDLEVELETRTKDVKARLSQLDVQVREWGWRTGSLGTLDLEVIAPPGEDGPFHPLDLGPGAGQGALFLSFPTAGGDCPEEAAAS